MANKTRNDLVNQALSNLGVLAAGQNPSPEDFQAVDDHVDQVVESLNARDVIYIPDSDDIPPEWFGPLTVVLADDAASEFGLPGMPASPSNPNPVQSAEDSLRLMTRGKPTGEVLEIDYF